MASGGAARHWHGGCYGGRRRRPCTCGDTCQRGVFNQCQYRLGNIRRPGGADEQRSPTHCQRDHAVPRDIALDAPEPVLGDELQADFFPIVAGVLDLSVLSPAVAAISISGGMLIVAVNAPVIKRTKLTTRVSRAMTVPPRFFYPTRQRSPHSIDKREVRIQGPQITYASRATCRTARFLSSAPR